MINIKIKNPYEYGALFCMVLAVLLMRPSLFGQEYTIYGGFLLFVICIWFGVVRKLGRQLECVYVLTVWVFLFWMYCAIVVTIVGDSNFDYAYKAIVAGMASAVFFGYLFADYSTNIKFFSLFSYVNSIVGWSLLITTVLVYTVGADVISYYSINIKGYSGSESINGVVMFPFSAVYGILSEYGIYRFVGLYRESGIAQMFFLWSTIYLVFLKKNWFWKLGALFGVLLCISTTSIVSVFAVLLTWGVRIRGVDVNKFLGFVGCATLVLLVLYFAPGVGIEDKSITHSTSFDDRILSMQYAWIGFPDILWGRGLYYQFVPYENVGINAISFVYFYGLIGFLIYVASFFIMPAFFKVSRRKYFTLVSPLFVTSLLMQPLIDAPLAWLLLFAIPPVAVEEIK